jgi:nucleotide-binding universal stress UspA family protein
MDKIKQILVPVDFQMHTDVLAEYALGVASSLAASATFYHVVESQMFYADFVPVNFTRSEEETFSHAKKKMTALVEQSKIRWPQCTGEIGRGDVIDTLLAHAREVHFDLIIMATHGASVIEKILLGSVTERLIKRAQCPVLVFKPK